MKRAFKSAQACELLAYVANQWGCDIEFLWARMPDDGVWRRGDNGKWFGGMFHVRENRVDPTADDNVVEILDLRCAPDMIDFIVDKKIVFPGWHMNKRHWITIILDGRMKTAQIKKLLDASFEIAGGK